MNFPDCTNTGQELLIHMEPSQEVIPHLTVRGGDGDRVHLLRASYLEVAL
jgi:hypothetical protein